MKSKLPRASVVAIGATLLTALLGAGNTGAAAQDKVPEGLEIVSRFTPEYTSRPLVQPLPAEGEDANGLPLDADDPTPEAKAGSLADLVSVQPRLDELPRELQCLAGAVYFEARGESLAGQLAVGRVIVARSKSGRFPDSSARSPPSSGAIACRRSAPPRGAGAMPWRSPRSPMPAAGAARPKARCSSTRPMSAPAGGWPVSRGSTITSSIADLPDTGPVSFGEPGRWRFQSRSSTHTGA